MSIDGKQSQLCVPVVIDSNLNEYMTKQLAID